MSIRFVVADDAGFAREIIKNAVTETGAICVGDACDGIEAYEVVERTLPDLVFLDMVMPLQNGLDVAKKIKKYMPDVKIIGCSSLDEKQVISKAFESGFDAYITKPFTKQQIIFEIENLFPKFKEAANE